MFDRSLGRSSVTIPPTWMQVRPLSWRVHCFLARHSDALAIRTLRRLAEAAVTLLHSENHDPRTNGEYRVVDRLAPRLQTVIDVGANRGDWTAYVVERCPEVQAYCFELAAPTRAILRSRFAHVANVRIMENGLSHCARWITVKYYPENDRLTSMFDYPHAERSLSLHERVERGDNFLAAEGLGQIDMLKVDAEGADLAVLRGFERALRSATISVIQFEYGFACILARACLIDFYELFGKYGYIVGRVCHTHVEFQPYRLEMENFFGPNFVAVQQSTPELIECLAQRSRRGKDKRWMG